MISEFYFLTEAAIEKLTPLRWPGGSGALEIDVGVLQDSDSRYAKLWLLAALFLCAAVLLGDLLFAASATAKLATAVAGGLALTCLAVAAATTALKHKRR